MPSIRRQLLAPSLLSVLVGLGLLQVADAAMDSVYRRQRYLDLLDRTVVRLQSEDSAAGLMLLRHQSLGIGLRFWLRPATLRQALPNQQIHVLHANDRTLLYSSRGLHLDGRSQVLHALQDVTQEVRMAHRQRLLTLAAGGVSLLIISSLLRRVFDHVLVQPLQGLSHQLEHSPLPPAPTRLISVAAQPAELQPIARSFNSLQQRLAVSWAQERSFIDGVAHELRTPITLISGYVQRLQRQSNAGSGQDPQALAALAREADRMGRLVRDLLDLARHDAGRLDVALSSQDLDDLLLQVYERLEPLASGRVRLHPPMDGHARVIFADPDRVEHCLTNLVDNALRHTPAGTPIDLFASDAEDSLVAHVRDHGPGIPAEDRERIFERFERGPTPTAGSGIGLALVKLLMERMGGSVRVEDVPGGGADFQLVFPAVPPVAS